MYSRAIVLDLDGTVLRTDKTISKETIASLQACKEKNICIVVATARSEKSAERYISQIKPHAIISNGGSLVTLNGNIIYEKKLSKEITNKIIQKCLKKKTGTITVENTEGYFSNKSVGMFNNLHTKYNDYSEDMSEAYKITVEIENLEVAEEIASTFKDCSMLCFTGEKWKRFAHKNATKIKALDELIRVINIDISQVISFGDDYNDIGMIKHAGIGVAMGNAIPELKEVADYITETNDNDGVAYYIDKFLLNRI